MKRNKKDLTKDNDASLRDLYQRLMVNIKYNFFRKNVKIISLSSVNKSEGTTTIATNLAIASAGKVNKVLLIDFNVINPNIHRYMNVSNNFGFSNLITDRDLSNLKYEDFQTFKTINNKILYILPIGTKKIDYFDFFNSKQFKDFLNKLRELFDLIILDCPPILSSPEVISLSNTSDGLVLIVSQVDTEIVNAKKAVKDLRRAGVDILGVIFNKVI